MIDINVNVCKNKMKGLLLKNVENLIIIPGGI